MFFSAYNSFIIICEFFKILNHGCISLTSWVFTTGGSGIVVGHPFDTIKTMQQTQTVSPLFFFMW